MKFPWSPKLKILEVNKLAKKKEKKVLLNLVPDKQFWLSDGRVVKNLFDLSRAFEEMSKETYNSHSGTDKNDFSKWAIEVFGEKRLAKRLAEANNKEKSQVAVLKHLVSSLMKK